MLSDNSYDVIVAGAGISGLLSALALGKEGKKVLVLEKSAVVGGNCRTYEVEDTGFFVDTGVHAITGLNGGPLINLMDKYFSIIPKFVPHGEYYVRYPAGFMQFPNTIKGFMTFKAISRYDRAKLTKIVLKAITYLSMSEKSDISAYDFIKNKGISETGMRLVNALAYFSSGVSMKDTPAWRILSAGGLLNDGERDIKGKISDFFKLAINQSYSEQGYPRGGIASITNCIMQSLPKNCTVKTGEEVIGIKEIDGSMKVETNNGNYTSEKIVYSGEVNRLPEIADMPKEWSDAVKKLKQSNAITIWLGLKKQIKPFDYCGSEIWFSEGVSYWAMPTSNYDRQLAPQGKQLVGFTAFMGSDENSVKYEKRLLETIYSAVPEIEKSIEMKHTQIIVPEKAAVSIGVKFPHPKTPVNNLYLAGTDADMRSMGITRAAYSVIEMLKAMNL